LANRLETYPLNPPEKQKETKAVKTISMNNQVEGNVLDDEMKRIQKCKKVVNSKTTKKWATFKYEYIGKQTKFISKLFKYTDLKIAQDGKHSRKFTKNKTQHRGRPIEEKWNLSITMS
jgi:hypothetical protein